MKQMYTGHVGSHLHALRIVAIAALLAGAGCVSAPQEEDATAMGGLSTVNLAGFLTQQIANDVETIETTLPVELDLVWRVLPGVYQELGIPVATSNPQKRQLGNLQFEVQRVNGKRMNHFIDCGTSRTGPMANAYQVTLTVMTTLEAVEETGGTKMSSIVDGTAANRSTAGYPVPCTSRETLEELISDKVAEVLGVSGS